MGMANVDDVRIDAKLLAIPVPQLSPKQYQAALAKNRQQDKENTAHTVHVMQELRENTQMDGKSKVNYVTMTVERDAQGQLATRERIRAINDRIAAIRKGINAECWVILEQFSELHNPRFWEGASKHGFDDVMKAQYYRDVWGLPIAVINKFLELLKLEKEKKIIQ